MINHVARAALAGASLGLFVVSGPNFAFADTITLYSDGVVTAPVADTYLGGLNTYGQGESGQFYDPTAKIGDRIGNTDFEINSVSVKVTGANLVVSINTNFVGHVGEDGVTLGALFLMNNTPNYNTAALNPPNYIAPGPPNSDPNHPYDMSSADPGRFQYGVTLGTGSASTVYSLPSDGSAIIYSNVSGNTPASVTGPVGGNWYFRQGQAVDVNGSAATVVDGASASHAIDTDANTLTFTIDGIIGIGLLSPSFTLAYAMTCANDVIYASFAPGSGSTATPLPAAILLMGSVLGAGGMIARRRRRKVGVATA